MARQSREPLTLTEGGDCREAGTRHRRTDLSPAGRGVRTAAKLSSSAEKTPFNLFKLPFAVSLNVTFKPCNFGS